MPLEEYQRKRNFRKTSEPAGGPVAGGGTRAGRYVVQRHRATRLHYDFRLEIDGVLVSWAVPKGPTLDPAARRMAVHVEDHPIEYFDFEGVIPKGEYGGGDVIVWDWGQWTAEPETPDGRRAVDDGELKFTLTGEKLRGRFTIVRTSGRGARGRERARDDDGGGEQWLLIHKRDDAAVDGWDAEDFPQSVKTGRTNDEVKADRDALWISKAPAAVAEIDLSAAVDARLPAFIEPMAATLTANGFRDDDWLFEIKWDGYRVEAVVSNGTAKVFTRNGNDAETYFPKLLTKATWIDAKEAIVDGEVVAIGEDGRPDFSLLQEATGGGSTRFVYQAFDLLHLDGRSLLKVPRKQTAYGTGAALAARGAYNHVSAIPTVGDNSALIISKGSANLAIRAWLLRNTGSLTAGVESSQVRIWGVAPMANFAAGDLAVDPANPQLISMLSGQWFGDVTFGTSAKLAVPATMLPAGTYVPSDSSYCDVITVAAGNPHTGLNVDLGAAGFGRWLRIQDTLGYPLIFLQWLNSAAAIQMNAEYYGY